MAGSATTAVAVKPSFDSKSGRHFIGGLGSGVTSAIILQPLDLLKTRVQQSTTNSLTANLKAILKSDNKVGSLWRGTIPSALRTGFGSAIYFTILNSLRQRAASLAPHAGKHGQSSSALPTLSNSANMATGATARTMAGLLLMPLTVIKVRYESTMYYSYSSIWCACKDIYKTTGVRGFFSGFGATAVRDGPNAGIYVLFYEQLKKRFSNWNITADSSAYVAPAVINFSAGISAGSACSAISNPFDAIKTRIQLQPNTYRNTFQTARKMFVENGVGSFFHGLGLRLTRKALSSALAWTAYEEFLRRMERPRLVPQRVE
ncbi:Solute carrier family 25 member 38 -like protein [Ceratocystis fimbriata CBS 114723]|uniref:Mitochondrial glycine transporter n=1 Tax=Ceratocystis fimbriata CBS 114723 TaxID=1035309 RepID=A0A2C5WU13_9PEZI|nr:Solute carrier family 25 member 38 -like protein [Ceratocystis fimbriata CBS 114723]